MVVTDFFSEPDSAGPATATQQEQTQGGKTNMRYLHSTALAGAVAIAATAGPAVAGQVTFQTPLFRSRRTPRMYSRAGRSLHSTSASPTR